VRPVIIAISMLLFAQPLEAQRPFTLPPGARVERDVAYGPASRQRLDVYIPAHADRAPVLFMVHGGGWTRGDKASAGVVRNKVGHWLPEGYIVVSINYRMVPEVDVRAEAEEVARALAYVQAHAQSWGGDANRVVMMGHSAGGHLVALVTADSTLAARAGVRPWLGTIGLDAGAYNVVTIMRARHFSLYDQAFGKDPAFWRSVSPTLRLDHATVPLLLACSSRRRDSCSQAEAFVARARAQGGQASVLPLDKTHAQIDSELGTDSAYTRAVDGFLGKAVGR
jgi:acetyl esterase/lipase